jgi:hypothetical protein
VLSNVHEVFGFPRGFPAAGAIRYGYEVHPPPFTSSITAPGFHGLFDAFHGMIEFIFFHRTSPVSTLSTLLTEYENGVRPFSLTGSGFDKNTDYDVIMMENK